MKVTTQKGGPDDDKTGPTPEATTKTILIKAFGRKNEMIMDQVIMSGIHASYEDQREETRKATTPAPIISLGVFDYSRKFVDFFS